VARATLLARPIYRLMDATDAVAQAISRVGAGDDARRAGRADGVLQPMARSLREKERSSARSTRYVAREVVEEC